MPQPAGVSPDNTGATVNQLATAIGNLIQAAILGGSSQAWTSVTGSRALGTTYTNSTARPISVSVVAISTNANTSITGVVDGNSVIVGGANGTSSNDAVVFVVPPGGTYSVTPLNATLSTWWELR